MDIDIDLEIERYFEKKRNDNSNYKKELAILEKKHVLDILYYLYEHPVCTKSDIYKEISRASTIGEKIKLLESLGLVEHRYVVNARGPVFYITSKGRTVMKNLLEIVAILKG